MVDTTKEQGNGGVEPPLDIEKLVPALVLDRSPCLLKKPFYQLNKLLKDWEQSITDKALLSAELNQAKQECQQKSRLAKPYQLRLSQRPSLDNLAKLLSQAQDLQSIQNESQAVMSTGIRQQKESCLKTCQQILLNHLKLYAQDDLVNHYHQLSKPIAKLHDFGIQVTQADTVEKIDNLLTDLLVKLKQRQEDIKYLEKLKSLFPKVEEHRVFIKEINSLNQDIEKNNLEHQRIEAKCQALHPFVKENSKAYQQAEDNFDSFENSYKSLAWLNSLWSSKTVQIKCCLGDESRPSHHPLQSVLHEHVKLTRKLQQLSINSRVFLSDKHQNEQKKENIEAVFREQGIDEFSTYHLLKYMKSGLTSIDPDFDYDYDYLKTISPVEERVNALVKTISDEIKQFKTIIPQLQLLKSNLTHILKTRQHYNISAANEELSQGYPWASPFLLTLEETTNLFETIMAWLKSEASIPKLQQALIEKQNILDKLEQEIYIVYSINQTPMQQNKKDQKSTASKNGQISNIINSTNLWEDYLEPLIKRQPENLKTWLNQCCQPKNKESLSTKEQFQFEQLCRDIYIELKYANNEENAVLLAYQAIFSQPKGLQRLLNLKLAIPIDYENQLPPLTNKPLSQALDQLKQFAKQEGGKIVDIIEQTCNQLHYLAWQGEQKVIDFNVIEEFQHQFADDPRYRCLQQSRHYESLIDWFHGIFQAIKQLFDRQTNPIYRYGLFHKHAAYLEQAVHLSQTIPVCA